MRTALRRASTTAATRQGTVRILLAQVQDFRVARQERNHSIGQMLSQLGSVWQWLQVNCTPTMLEDATRELFNDEAAWRPVELRAPPPLEGAAETEVDSDEDSEGDLPMEG